MESASRSYPRCFRPWDDRWPARPLSSLGASGEPDRCRLVGNETSDDRLRFPIATRGAFHYPLGESDPREVARKIRVGAMSRKPTSAAGLGTSDRVLEAGPTPAIDVRAPTKTKVAKATLAATIKPRVRAVFIGDMGRSLAGRGSQESRRSIRIGTCVRPSCILGAVKATLAMARMGTNDPYDTSAYVRQLPSGYSTKRKGSRSDQIVAREWTNRLVCLQS